MLDRRHLHRVPRPATEAVFSDDGDDDGPTAEELALLPLCALPAYRAVRTLDLPVRAEGPPCAVVLNAHTGAGACAVQLLASRGARVLAQVPDTAGADGEPDVELEARPYTFGAADVLAGGPVGMLTALAEAHEKVHAVIDTIGGRDVWDAARALLAATGPGGQFATLVGDAPARPLPRVKDHFRAGMRSLGGGKDERAPRGAAGVGYAWVVAGADIDAAGQDVRDALAALVPLVVSGALRPCAHGRGAGWEQGASVPFEAASEAFVPARCAFADGGTVVVKLLD